MPEVIILPEAITKNLSKFDKQGIVENWSYYVQHTKSTIGLSGVHTQYK